MKPGPYVPNRPTRSAALVDACNSLRSVIVAELDAEAVRYRELAGQEALKSLDSLGDAPARLARSHLLRAETFRAAAAIAAGGAK